MKAFTHKKTDKIDSEVIAQLALNKMIQPSRVFPKDHREFRSYVRLRHKLVQKRTDIKNEAHAILAPEMFNLNDDWQIFLARMVYQFYQELLQVRVLTRL
jgi:transposase